MSVSELALFHLELFKIIILVNQSLPFDDLSKDELCVLYVTFSNHRHGVKLM